MDQYCFNNKFKMELDIDRNTKEIKTEIFIEKDIKISNDTTTNNLIIIGDKLYEKIKLNSTEDLNLYMTDDSIYTCEISIVGMKFWKGGCNFRNVVTKLYIKNMDNVQPITTINKNDDNSIYSFEITI